jgi:hypothetical protein
VGAHDGIVTDDGSQAATDTELVQQGLWNLRHGAAQQNDIERAVGGGASSTVCLANLHVGDAGLLQVAARQGGV